MFTSRSVDQSCSEGVSTVLSQIQAPQVAYSPEVIHPWSVSPACCCSSIYTYFLFLSDSDSRCNKRTTEANTHLRGRWGFFMAFSFLCRLSCFFSAREGDALTPGSVFFFFFFCGQFCDRVGISKSS